METAIYIRTSTEEQNPYNQVQDIVSLIPNEAYILYEDKQSAWKEDKDRDGFQKLLKAIRAKKIEKLIVWDMDRIYRNRKRLKEFLEFLKYYKVKLYSYRQKWLEDLNKIPSPFDEIVYDLVINILGWIAEEESNKKSERVKAAMTKVGEETYSVYGHKWGRKNVIDRVKNRVIKLRSEGLSMRQIAKEVYYWDNNNNKKYISLGVVHKILSENQV